MGLVLPLLVCAFLLLLFVRALLFRPVPQPKPAPVPVHIDGERAVCSLARMVRLPTVSHYDPANTDPAPFDAFRALLRELYPRLHERCTLERFGSGGLLYLLPGKQHDKPTVLMAHYDVVPANADAWQKPPFSGLRENGELWGRGTLDTKCTLCAMLEAAEALLADGFVPANDVYFSFGADEEVAGHDTPAIVAALQARGIRPALVLDEGGAIVEHIFPGVHIPCALVGIAEKGMLNVEFSITGAGGHASAPPTHSPVGILAQAVTKIEKKPFPAQLTKPAREMFDTLGRHSTFLYRLLFANLWCFKGLLAVYCQKAGGELNALMRTTCAFTVMDGSSAFNVLPPNARVGANLRLIGADTPASAQERLKRIAANDAIAISAFDANPPSPYSDTSGEGFHRVKTAIQQTWPRALVSPYLMVACTDSRHFHAISDTVLRFSALELSAEERNRIHANDERITETKLHDAVAFFMRALLQS